MAKTKIYSLGLNFKRDRLTGVHDPLVDLHIGLGGEPLGAVLALEAPLALVQRLDVMNKFCPETDSMKISIAV